MVQILRPDEQLARSGTKGDSLETTDLHNKINDLSDSTYLKLDGYVTVGLPAPSNTPSNGDSTIYFRAKSSMGGGKVTVEIYQGATYKNKLAQDVVTGDVVEYSFSQTLDDYSDLRLKIILYGPQSSYKYPVCYQAWVEVPDAVSGIGLEMGCNF